ncbi:MAG TPA: hypothetical protein H9979_05730, partial [Candidatus Megamonas gallistercoris]|nr:hypothetical protein [Candidatus Megamonas gallistercoris]
ISRAYPSDIEFLETDIHTPHWEYVVSQGNLMYYVDTNQENILSPDKNTVIFYICTLENNQYAIMKMGVRVDDNKKFFYKREYFLLLDGATKKIIQEDNMATNWNEVREISAPVIQCLWFIYNKYYGQDKSY